MDRRKFLLTSLGTVASFAVQQFIPGMRILARADALDPKRKDHFFVLIRTQGGMDCTLGLDPQIYRPGITESDIFIEYRPSDILEAGQLRLAPAAKALLPFAKDCATINGIFMSSGDLGHDVGNTYISKGSPQREFTLPIGLAVSEGTGPYGVLFDGSGSGNSSIPVLTSQVNDILSGRITDEDLAREVSDYVQNNGSSSFEKAQGAFVESLKINERFQKTLSGFRKKGEVTPYDALAAAFAAGGARQAEIVFEFDGNLDTHSNHPGTHLTAQTGVWRKIAQLFTAFKSIEYQGKTMFDSTTFMVISEFSRTPALNGAKGKDHNNNTNSVLLAGYGINGGRSYGGSKVIPREKNHGEPLHIAAPIDASTGQIAKTRENAIVVRPENIAHSLAAIFNYPNGFEIDRTAKVIPGLVKG